jgi:hypothetical protein
MSRTISIITLLSIFLFFLLGPSFAGPVAILTPTTGDQFVSGRVNPIILDIEWSQLTGPVAKYTLYYRKGPYVSWTQITNRYCSISSECSDSNPCCPTYYPWEVPSLAKNKNNAQVKVKFFDVNGNIIATKKISAFTILAYGSAHPLSISPHSRTASSGGVEYYWISYGQPPYTVDTGEHAITTVYEEQEPPEPPMPPVTINANIFFVKNMVSDCSGGTDINVTVVVTDATDSTATANYIIDCTP